MVSDETHYDGIPHEDLPIDAIEWTEARIEHVRSRSQRYGAREFDVEPEWATEAALDVDRLIAPDLPRCTAVKVIGQSPSAPPRVAGEPGRILKVWLVPKSHPPVGDWWGVSACEANSGDRRRYRRREETP